MNVLLLRSPGVALLVCVAAGGVAGVAGANDAPAATSPAPSPAPRATAANDPCGGSGRLLATLNRPTVGYSACAVPAGALVLEEGYQNTFPIGVAGTTTAAYPQGFERYGAAERLELDLIGPNQNRSRAGSRIASGSSDLGFGFKYELPPRGRLLYALDGIYTFPSGTGGFSNGAATQTLNLDVAYAASPAVGLGTTLGVSDAAGFYQPDPAMPALLMGRYGTFNPSFVITTQVPGFCQFYAELVGQTKVAPFAGGRIYTDFGVQKLLGPNLEFDLEYGFDVVPANGSRVDYIGFGTGIRVR